MRVPHQRRWNVAVIGGVPVLYAFIRARLSRIVLGT
jgi:hypothetical protein